MIGSVGIAGGAPIGKLYRNIVCGAQADIIFTDDCQIARNMMDRIAESLGEIPLESIRFSGDDKPHCIWHDTQKVDSFTSKHRGGGKSKRNKRR